MEMSSNKRPVEKKQSAIQKNQGIDYLKHADDGGVEGKMAKKGYAQGDMSPVVDDFQKPDSNYSQRQYSKTTEYIERKNRMGNESASGIEKQAYRGRYDG